jgi:trans-aconitate 2-methyltransferase
MLEQARGRLSSFGERVRFVEADLLDLTPDLLGSDQPVDAVFSTATFHWVKDHDALFRNLAAVLRRGGQLVAQCGAAGNVERVIRSARAAGMELEDSWNFASPDDTIKRLEHSGFTAIRVWTHAEPTAFPDAETLIEFLETACLGEHLAGLPAPERRDLAGRIATRMDEPVIDYQRLNIVARRSEL